MSTALPESRNPEQVSVTVKAFMKHDLQVSRWQGVTGEPGCGVQERGVEGWLDVGLG